MKEPNGALRLPWSSIIAILSVVLPIVFGLVLYAISSINEELMETRKHTIDSLGRFSGDIHRAIGDTDKQFLSLLNSQSLVIAELKSRVNAIELLMKERERYIPFTGNIENSRFVRDKKAD